MKEVKVGVLALQGGFREHIEFLLQAGAQEVREVRLPAHLQGLDALIIPGGESTTIGKLAKEYGLIDPLRQFAQTHAIWGSCAGAIFLSKDAQREQPLLGLMDIVVERNAFGSQIDSFETSLSIPECFKGNSSANFQGIFIRAPVLRVAKGHEQEVQVLASLKDGRVVAVRQGNLLATSFHPELTHPVDFRFHEFFLQMVGTK